MRVISGMARGLKLKAPEGMNTRPTTDRIKESLFNIIADRLYDICFLDLFSGSGSIGIEALSRGARKAYFCDNNAKSITVIKDNINRAKFTDDAVVIQGSFLQALERVKADGEKIDIAFLDPPYNTDLAVNALENIVRLDLLDDSGLIIVEQAAGEPDLDIKGLVVTRVKDYKTTKMTYLEKEDQK